ncbi:hypothetical protein SDC9_69932 [bioreactor metagenome]|uniref:Uncharacterized protein n=1 Tax=bioreactor metagenome TaxID=1076179 RepID=A0A644Y576_9ZZZZ
MNKIIRPSLFLTSSRTALSLSSNSPLNFAPATNELMSREKIFLSFRLSGTSPRTIRIASPSAMAVFPTPGSPMSTGLFFVFLDKILTTFRISESRPITGSSLLFFASSTRSEPYFASTSYVDSGESLVTRVLPLTEDREERNLSFVRLNSS